MHVPAILLKTDDPELQLALALCLLHTNEGNKLLMKRDAQVPKRIISELKRADLVHTSHNRVRVVTRPSKAEYKSTMAELTQFVNNKRFAGIRAEWAAEFWKEQQDIKEAANFSTKAHSKIRDHMGHREANGKRFYEV